MPFGLKRGESPFCAPLPPTHERKARGGTPSQTAGRPRQVVTPLRYIQGVVALGTAVTPWQRPVET